MSCACDLGMVCKPTVGMSVQQLLFNKLQTAVTSLSMSSSTCFYVCFVVSHKLSLFNGIDLISLFWSQGLFSKSL